MKRVLALFSALVLALSLCACGSSSQNPAAEKTVDVDLTKLSSTMVYSEVYNMCVTPDDYVGKIVRMKGQFAVYPGEIRNYYACVISDATACCQQGIEFLLTDEQYPTEGEEITVKGRFETYMEGPQMYIQLADAVLE